MGYNYSVNNYAVDEIEDEPMQLKVKKVSPVNLRKKSKTIQDNDTESIKTNSIYNHSIHTNSTKSNILMKMNASAITDTIHYNLKKKPEEKSINKIKIKNKPKQKSASVYILDKSTDENNESCDIQIRKYLFENKNLQLNNNNKQYSSSMKNKDLEIDINSVEKANTDNNLVNISYNNRTPSDLVSFNPATTGLNFHPMDIDFINHNHGNMYNASNQNDRKSHNPNNYTQTNGSSTKYSEKERKSVN